MASPETIACLILAAGASRRFGSAKLLHSFDKHQTILQATVEQCLAVFESVYVVVSPLQGEVAQSLRCSRVALIENAKARLGMSQSVVEGVARTNPSTGWLIVLGDMPYVQVDTIEQVIKPLTPESIIVPTHAGKPGNPVAFGLDFSRALLGLSGDAGAKQVVQAKKEFVHFVETSDHGIHRDIDVPADLTR